MNDVRTASRKSFVGLVSSTKMNKTITVEVERKFSHPRFKKLVIMHKKYHVHDEKEEAGVGDKVKIIETKPISKTKFFRLDKIVEKAG
jgi:small subunit ribosomal protein S17